MGSSNLPCRSVHITVYNGGPETTFTNDQIRQKRSFRC